MFNKCFMVAWNKNSGKDVKMFDIISIDFLKENDFEEVLLDLGYKEVFVCKSIKKKEDFVFSLPKTKKLLLKKAVLLEDFSLINQVKEKDILILTKGGDIKLNTQSVNNKNSILYNPIGQELCFDEGLAEISKQNNKIICFNINEIRTNQYRSIKQMRFIINILKEKQVEMFFVTLAKRKSDLIDFKILECFLENFNLEKETIKRFLKIE